MLAKQLYAAACGLWRTGRHAEAGAKAVAAVAASEAAGAPGLRILVHALLLQAAVEHELQPAGDTAVGLRRRALALARADDDPMFLVDALNTAAATMGRVAETISLLLEAVDIAERTGATGSSLAHLHFTLADLAERVADPRALDFATRALAVSRQFPSGPTPIHALLMVGRLRLGAHDVQGALAVFEEARAMLDEQARADPSRPRPRLRGEIDEWIRKAKGAETG